MAVFALTASVEASIQITRQGLGSSLQDSSNNRGRELKRGKKHSRGINSGLKATSKDEMKMTEEKLEVMEWPTFSPGSPSVLPAMTPSTHESPLLAGRMLFSSGNPHHGRNAAPSIVVSNPLLHEPTQTSTNSFYPTISSSTNDESQTPSTVFPTNQATAPVSTPGSNNGNTIHVPTKSPNGMARETSEPWDATDEATNPTIPSAFDSTYADGMTATTHSTKVPTFDARAGFSGDDSLSVSATPSNSPTSGPSMLLSTSPTSQPSAFPINVNATTNVTTSPSTEMSTGMDGDNTLDNDNSTIANSTNSSLAPTEPSNMTDSANATIAPSGPTSSSNDTTEEDNACGIELTFTCIPPLGVASCSEIPAPRPECTQSNVSCLVNQSFDLNIAVPTEGERVNLTSLIVADNVDPILYNYTSNMVGLALDAGETIFASITILLEWTSLKAYNLTATLLAATGSGETCQVTGTARLSDAFDHMGHLPASCLSTNTPTPPTMPSC